MQVQLANALPYDLEEAKLSEYKNFNPRWHDWQAAKAVCSHIADVIFDEVRDMKLDYFRVVSENELQSTLNLAADA